MTTLEDVRGYIASIAKTLDPASRYVPELLSIVDASADLADFERRMAAGCRGQRHAGAEVFARMSLEQRVRCNLITNETVLFRFSEGEWDVLQRRLIPRFAATGGTVLCAPCSHGEEAFSVAAACLQAGVKFEIDAIDIQPECIREAKTGRLTMGFPATYLDSPAVVGSEVRRHIHFDVADLLLSPGAPGAIPAKKWDLIVCRNFLGYFVEPVAVQAAARLAAHVAPGGALFVDSFCVGKFSSLEPALRDAKLARDGSHPVFVS